LGADLPDADRFGGPVVNDVGHRNRIPVKIETDQEDGRLVHG
jgi:hypothetical protein